MNYKFMNKWYTKMNTLTLHENRRQSKHIYNTECYHINRNASNNTTMYVYVNMYMYISVSIRLLWANTLNYCHPCILYMYMYNCTLYIYTYVSVSICLLLAKIVGVCLRIYNTHQPMECSANNQLTPTHKKHHTIHTTYMY